MGRSYLQNELSSGGKVEPTSGNNNNNRNKCPQPGLGINSPGEAKTHKIISIFFPNYHRAPGVNRTYIKHINAMLVLVNYQAQT